MHHNTVVEFEVMFIITTSQMLDDDDAHNLYDDHEAEKYYDDYGDDDYADDDADGDESRPGPSDDNDDYAHL